jgi:hypothetical protein
MIVCIGGCTNTSKIVEKNELRINTHIGGYFADGRLFAFWQIFENYTGRANVWDIFSTEKVFIKYDKNGLG